MAWSNVDIKKNLNRKIIIHPYSEDACTGYSYDISIKYIRSLSKESTCKIEGSNVKIPKKTAFCIITSEYFRLDNSVFANINARLSSTSKGIKINATAIEPEFGDSLMIYGRNSTNHDCTLDLKSVATVVFHSLDRPSIGKTPTNDDGDFWDKHVSADEDAKTAILAELQKIGIARKREIQEIETEFAKNKQFFHRLFVSLKDLPRKLDFGIATKTLAILSFILLSLSNIGGAYDFLKNLF